MAKSWKAKKDHLTILVKKVSDHHGGDTEEWLCDYLAELIKRYEGTLEIPIGCFEEEINSWYIFGISNSRG